MAEKRGENMNKQMMWVLVVVALIVGTFCGYYFEKQKVNQAMMAESAAQQQVQSLQMKNDQLMKSNKMMQTTPEPTGMMMHAIVTPTGAMMGH